MDTLIALQPLLLGALLGWAGLGKTFGRYTAERARRTALSRLLGQRHAPAAYRATGVVELLVAAALLTPASWRWEPVAVSALTICFLAFLGYTRLAAPDSSCGCLGTTAAPVSSRTLARAVLLVAGAGSIFLADQAWTAAAAERPMLCAVFGVSELAAFVGLSAELDRWWLFPLRRLRLRIAHPLTDRASHTPLASTVQQAQRSPAYRSLGGSVRSDVLDHWDEGDWRFLTYAVTTAGEPATAVFAVPLDRYDPEAVRVAVVDEDSGETLYRPAPAQAR